MNNKLFVWIIIILSLSVSCYSVPPFLYASTAGQLDIDYPQIAIIKQNKEIQFNFHVYNWTGTPINSHLTCTFDLYNSYGYEIYEGTTNTSNNLDYTFNLSGGNFSTLESYGYIIFCYNKTLNVGGMASVPFVVTEDGFDNTPDTSPSLTVLLFMLFIIIGLFILGFVGKFNRFEIVNLCIRRGCFVVGIMISMYTSTLLLNVMNYANLDILSKEMVFLMTWIGWTGYIAAVYLVIKTLFDIVSLRKKGKENKVYGEVL